MIRAICSFLAIAAAVSSQSTQSTAPASPCPDVFTYEPLGSDQKPEPGKWYGNINLYTDITLYSLWLNVVVDSKADILGNWVGEVTTTDNLNFKIENTNIKIPPGAPFPVRFFIQYNPQKKIPKLQFILFNGRKICNVDAFDTSVELFNSTLNNHAEPNRILGRTEFTSTTVRAPTTVTRRNIYDRSQTKSQFKQETTTKPNYWSTVKIGTTQATTQRSQSRFGTTSTPNKAKSTTNIYSWDRPKMENNQQQKPPNNVLTKNKNETQSRPTNNSQAGGQSWPQNKFDSKQQTNNRPTNNENTIQPTENILKVISEVLTQIKEENPLQKKPEKLRSTTERNSQASFGRDTYPKPQTWSNAGYNEQVKTETKQQLARGEVSLWSEVKVDTDEKIEKLQDTRFVPQNTRQRNQGSDVSTELNQPKEPYEVLVKEVVTDEFQRPGTRQQVQPVEFVYTDIPPRNVNGDSLERQPINTAEEIPVSKWSQDQVKLIFGTPASFNKNREQSRNVDVSTLPSSSGYQLSTVDPAAITEYPPIIEDFDIISQTDEEHEFYPSGGLPTLYIPNIAPDTSCGKVVKKSPQYLPRGSSTSEGQWPWQTAIYQQQTVNFKYICGGTLVSHRHVITAAHCVTRKNSRRTVKENTLTVYLGKFNLRTSVEGVQVKFVKHITVHPEYNATIFSRDLAILELRESASFTDWVRPACLWPEHETDLYYIVGKKGSVVGWGFEVTGTAREELSLLEMPIVDQETCINSYIDFYEKFTSDYTYCAGYKDGTTVCNGDSGGGMVFKRGSSWYLRGLASLSVARHNEYRCDPKHFVIFTDIAKFLPWIEQNIDND